MIFLIILLIFIIFLSLFLTLISMRDYKEAPKDKKGEYGLFLIRNFNNLSYPLILGIYSKLLEKRAIISFERLFKGGESALTIFGPKSILSEYSSLLDLLELEDYVNLDYKNLSIWEIGLKLKKVDINFKGAKIFEDLKLNLDEQVWFQIILKANSKDVNQFLSQIRMASQSLNEIRRKNILQANLKPPFIKIPRPYSIENMLKFYKDRAIGKDKNILSLDAKEVLNLILLS